MHTSGSGTQFIRTSTERKDIETQPLPQMNVLKVLIAAVALLIASIGNGTQAQNQNPST
jgi:hypothetical protein